MEPDRETQAGYEAKMLMENRIEGLLDFHMKYVDDRQIYYYDITSMQPLSRMTEGRWISREEVCRLLIRIDAVLNRAREYLLDGDHLLLDADYIYMDPQWEQISFCFVPGLHESFSEALSASSRAQIRSSTAGFSTKSSLSLSTTSTSPS